MEEDQIRPKTRKMAVIEPQRAAITTKEAVSGVIIQEKMTEIWEVDYTCHQGQGFPIWVLL